MECAPVETIGNVIYSLFKEDFPLILFFMSTNIATIEMTYIYQYASFFLNSENHKKYIKTDDYGTVSGNMTDQMNG